MRATGTDEGAQGRGSDSLLAAFSKMFSGTLVSRVLGMVRTVLLVAALGVTGSADAFGVANNLPTVIYNLLAGGVLNAILVPAIVRAMKKRNDDEFVNRLLTMAGLLLFIVTLAAVGLSTVLVALYANSLPPQWFDLAVAFALYCLPQIFFYGIYALLGNVLNAKGNFGPYMWAPVVNNVVAIAGLLAYIGLFGLASSTGADRDAGLWDAGRIAWVGIPATLGVALQAAVLVIPLRRTGFRFRAIWGVRDSGLRGASTMASWTFAALLVGQLGYIMVSNVGAAATAHTAATGEWVASVTAYNSAFGIYMLPQSLITTSLVTALFTRMSAKAADRDGAAVRDDMSFGLRTVGLFTVLSAAALAVLAIPVIQAVVPSVPAQYSPGFGAVLVGLSVGIPAQGMWSVVQRVSYAYEDARTIFWIQVPMALVVVAGGALALLFPAWWWMPLQTLGISLSNMLGAVVGYLALRRKLPDLDGSRVLRTYLRFLLAALPAALVAWVLLHFLGPVTVAGGPGGRFLIAFLKVGLLGLLMLGIYVALLHRMAVPELERISAPALRMLRRLRGTTRAAAPPAPIMDQGPGSGPVSGPVSWPGEREEPLVRPTQQTSSGTLLAQRFRLEELRAGTAAGGEIWSGEDLVLVRPIEALLIPAGTAQPILDAARRAALIEDDRFTRVVDTGEAAVLGVSYVISEALVGVPLDALAGRIEPEAARAIVGEAAAALEGARRRGVHHGHLEPGLISVTPDGEVLIAGLGYLAAAHGEFSEGADPVEASIARSQADATALVRLHQYLRSGQWPSEVSAPANAGHVIRSLAPWGAITLPKDAVPLPESPAPAWRKLRRPDDDAPPPPPLAPPTPDAPTDPSLSWAPRPPADALSEPEFQSVISGPGDGASRARAAHAAPGSSRGWKVLLPGTSATLEDGPGSPEDEAAADPVATDAEEQVDPPAVEVPADENSSEETAAAEIAADEESAPSPPEAGEAAPVRAKVVESLATAAATTVAVARAGTELARQGAEKAREATSRVSEKVDDFVDKHEIHVPGELDEDDNAELPFSRRKVDPGPFVIAFTVVAVIAVTVISVLNLLLLGAGRGAVEATPAPTSTAAAPAEGTATPSAPAAVVDPAATPTIASLAVLDPQGDGDENPELTGLSVDGDPATYWRSRSYVNPSYGMKQGIGLAVSLQQPALVSEIELTLQGNGGHVQVKSDPADPVSGAVLAEADLGPTTVIKLPEPTELSTLVLWFTALPVADSDGKNRIELGEIAVR